MVRDAIREDYTKFYPKPEYLYRVTEVPEPRNKPPYDEGRHYPEYNIGNLREMATHAIRMGGAKEALRALRAEARLVMPSLDFPPRKSTAGRGDAGADGCATPGGSCSERSCCGNETSCVYVSALDASFCVTA